MRIVPVTGDLPALATPPPAPVRHLAEPAPVPATAPVAQTAAARGSSDAGARSHQPPPQPFFDPPLIAQRAVLGLPTGFLIADFARSQGISYAAAVAAVDREMPPTDD